MKKYHYVVSAMVGAAVLLSHQIVNAGIEVPSSSLQQVVTELRYDYSVQSIREAYLQQTDESGSAAGKTPGRKSPAKAFLLSLALPGAGQYYNGGSILKPLAFLAVEATAWGLYFKYHGDGNDLTDQFEAFNREHWSKHRYSTYLEIAYGAGDDDSISAQEISHHLPDEMTQQFYEMTGKYNQFAWGWDDATLGDLTWDDSLGTFNPPRLNDPANIPYSANRLAYETMRNEANNKFDKATTMIIVSMANRVISAFEAYLTARRHNKSVAPTEFNRIDVQTRLRSVYSFADTPTLKVSLRF